MQFVCQSLKCLEFLRGRTGGPADDEQGYDPISNMDFLQQEGEFASDDDGGADWGRDIGTSGSRVIGRSKCSSDSTTPSTRKAGDRQSSENRRKKPNEEDTTKKCSDDRDLFNELGMEAEYKSPKLIHVSNNSRQRTSNSKFPSVSNILAKSDSVEGSGGLESWADVGVDFDEAGGRGKT
eukprot:GHVS01030793.1.p2 GENE.GHVS01030793.1~~GHVS01030793.1.p2  ORF type:complete len:180 (+),score=34.18 GHVS01030793.1:115-654(+)